MLSKVEEIKKLSPQRVKGNLIVFTGPSGVGKGTVDGKVREELTDLEYSISCTTREKRPGEKDGVNYFYKTRKEFEELIKNDQLLEWAEFVGNYYGTPKDFVEHKLSQGKDVLLEIEVQGALQVKEKYPEAIMIFLLPPSFEELENRLKNRSTEDEKTIQKRLVKAKHEMNETDKFDYFIINEEVDKAADLLKSIILSERAKVSKLKGFE